MIKKTPAVNVVNRGNKWAVVRDGARRASRVFETQQAAITYGKSIARRQRTELWIKSRRGGWRELESPRQRTVVRIHDRKGRLRASDSYPLDALIDEVIEEYRPALESLAQR